MICFKNDKNSNNAYSTVPPEKPKIFDMRGQQVTFYIKQLFPNYNIYTIYPEDKVKMDDKFIYNQVAVKLGPFKIGESAIIKCVTVGGKNQILVNWLFNNLIENIH